MSLLQVAKQPRAVASSAFDAVPCQFAKRPHLQQHLFIVVPGNREAFITPRAIMMRVNDTHDMQILVGINFAHDTAAANCSPFVSHTALLRLSILVWVISSASCTRTRQQIDRASGPSRITRIDQAKSRRSTVPDD
jgi:hypothetical protein